MIDDRVLEMLITWLSSGQAADVGLTLVDEWHPARMWLAKPMGAEDDSFSTLVRVLARGGHLPLLASIVFAVQARSRSCPPPEVELGLAEALRSLDEDQRRQRSSVNVDVPDVFFCYAHEDSERIAPILQTLRAASLNVFRDTDAIHPGESIAASIATAASVCLNAIVVVSHASCASEWVSRELSLLLARAGTAATPAILPVVIDDVTLPESVRDFFSIDLRDLAPSLEPALIKHRLQPLIDIVRRHRDGIGVLFQS